MGGERPQQGDEKLPVKGETVPEVGGEVKKAVTGAGAPVAETCSGKRNGRKFWDGRFGRSRGRRRSFLGRSAAVGSW